MIKNSLTDHYTILVSLEQSNRIYKHCSTSYIKINYEKISQELNGFDFQPVLNLDDCNDALNYLINVISGIIQKHSRPVTLPRRKTPKKPWITPGLIRCMKNRDNMHKKLRHTPDNEILKCTYRRYRNFLNGLLRKLKLQYERSQFEQAKTPRDMWNVINSIVNLKPPKNQPIELISLGSSELDSVNIINNYFVNVGETLARTILITSCISSTEIQHNSPPMNSFSLTQTDLTEVVLLINSFKNKLTTGHDNISMKLIKENKNILAGLITHICNLSINNGCFPSSFKKSLVTPVYKNGPKNSINNYRPISILPAMSKILERIINSRLVTYLEKFNLLSENQYGFRRNRSTADAVANLTDHIASNLDKGVKCLAIFLDLAKAFDTVSVPLLLQKLEFMGIRGLQLKLFEDYLSNRYQCVKLGSVIGDAKLVSYGVPQGSILGPTLFLVYINELCNIKLHNGKIFSFADDTCLVFQGESWKSVYKDAQIGLNTVSKWLGRNLLTLNTTKTKYIAFSILKHKQPDITYVIKSHKPITDDTPTLCDTNSCNCPNLERTDIIKYLGVLLDSTLSYQPHVKALSGRVRKLMAIFKNIRHAADNKVLKTVYYALCQSLLLYCIDSWGGCAKTHLLPLEIAQRGVLKVMRSLPFRFSTDILYQECQVLSVRKLFVLRIIMKQHKNLPQVDPQIDPDKRVTHIVFHTSKCRTVFAHRFSIFLGSFLYNRISKSIQLIKLNSHDLKKTLTMFLMSLDYDSTEALFKIDK